MDATTPATRRTDLDWLRVLAVLGFGGRLLHRPSRLLSHANEAVLPFYVLHQTVLLAVGYFVVGWPLPDLLKFVFIGAGSFALIVLAYVYLIRRVNTLRFLVGMRPLARGAMPRPATGVA